AINLKECVMANLLERLRHSHFGEGSYGQSEMVIQRLLAEAGASGIGDDLVSVDARGFELGADWASLKSPENYVGYERTEGFASPHGAVRDKPQMYEVPAQLRLNIGRCPGIGR
ncbi:MAG: hypothetical protein WCC54_06760, partial [Pseudolabrys sp.]